MSDTLEVNFISFYFNPFHQKTKIKFTVKSLGRDLFIAASEAKEESYLELKNLDYRPRC